MEEGKKKVLIRKRRVKGIAVAILFFLLAICFFKLQIWFFAWSIGLLAIGVLISLLSSSRYIKLKEIEEYENLPFDVRFNDTGIFTYQEDGVTANFKDGACVVKWLDIETIIAYKRDRMTTDCICLDVFYLNTFSFGINEGTKGWYQFLVKMSEAFPQIKRGWEIEIAQPPFKTNLTLLFDKKGRTLEEVMKINYK